MTAPMTDPMTSPVRVGTRGSALARAQTGWLVRQLEAAGVACETVVVRTEGDRSATPLVQLAGETGGTGIFTSALRDALLVGDIDLAVHSAKDLPTAPAAGIATAAMPEREDPADVLVAVDGADLAGLPPGARVGTGSPRRAAQLRAVRPDVDVVEVRGNVDTRLGMVGHGLDAVVLAAAGLARLGRSRVGVRLAFDVMLPAPGQGALAVEAREDDVPGGADGIGGAAWADAVRAIDHRDTRASVCAERAILATLEAGCASPIGALAWVDADGLRLEAVVLASDGTVLARGRGQGPPHEAGPVGDRVARELLAVDVVRQQT